jgi:uncharacterized membrane protein YbhN (UPF0104 family)
MFVLALVSLSFMVPSSPGAVGTFHLAATKALEIGFNVDSTTALSFSLVVHLVSFAPPTLLGAWAVWRSGFSLGKLMAFGKKEAEIEAIHEPEPAPALSSRPERR